MRRVSRFKALYGKAKGRALNGTSLPESLVADRTMALVLMRDQSLEYVFMTSNALIRSGKGNRGGQRTPVGSQRNTGSRLAGWTGKSARWYASMVLAELGRRKYHHE